MSITLTPPPIAMSDHELRARIAHLDRAVERAHERGRWQDAEDYQDALDACHIELAERGAREPDALARSLDAYDVDVARAMVLADVYERR